MWGTIISGLIQGASALAKASAGNKAERAQQDAYNNQTERIEKERQTNPFNTRQGQGLLNKFRAEQERVTEIARAREKILGATPETTLARKAQGANAMSDAISSVYKAHESRGDNLLSNLWRTQDNKNLAKVNSYLQRMRNWGQLASNASNLASNAADTSGYTDTTSGTSVTQPQNQQTKEQLNK